MKRILFFIASVLFLASCSSGGDDEPQQTTNKDIAEIWHSLNGSSMGTYYLMNTDNLWYTETITFHPYSEPREILPIFESKCLAYGTAYIVDTRFFDISGTAHCYYSIDVRYSGATPTISFFKYGDDGSITDKEDKRNIRILDSGTITIWSYGLSEKENSHNYIKQ